jgi:YfiH family protein
VAFTDRQGGHSAPPYDSFNLGRWGEDDTRAAGANVGTLGSALGCERLAFCAQVHSATVVKVDEAYPTTDPQRPDATIAASLPQADALVTRRAGVGLVIRVADCVPVMLADPAGGVIAAAHAGRVGLLAGVLDATLAAMRECGAARIQAWIGPHICAACYEVPAAMAADSGRINPGTRARSRQGTPAIDLGAGACAVLERAGVSVVSQDPCTACDSRFFSHRRDQSHTGRQCGAIWIAQ